MGEMELTKREATFQLGLAAVMFTASMAGWTAFAWGVARWVLGSGPL